ncbi:hypothetical protein [Thiohalophilus sp.]|uniref:hypothetical protein n=1 Tax=Thiohalophilus sp. TaxID=3028392 RepID=UPI002ACEB07E|nr:hypothetical protein [Thiohalophilus sp.]MDZ7802385.1 hypothetical protein [Thiohalophilus sp.]
MTHNEAVLIALLKNANRWVALPEIREFTKHMCKSECYPVHSRSSDLKNNYGYATENKTENRDGVKHSFYRIRISEKELVVLRRLYKKGSIPHFSQVSGEAETESSRIWLEC